MGRVFRYLVCFLVATALARGAFGLVRYLLREPPMWEASSGQPVPAEFCYLMFPSDPAKPIVRDPATGKSLVLGRAMMNTQGEVTKGGEVNFNGPNDIKYLVLLNELTYSPPGGDPAIYAQAWTTDLAARGSDLSGASFRFESHGPQSIAELSFSRSRGWLRFRYEVNSAGAKPLAMWHDEPGDQAPLLAAGGSFLAAVFVFCGTWVVLARWVRRSEKLKPIA